MNQRIPGCGAWLPLTDRKAQARGARRLRLGRLGGKMGQRSSSLSSSSWSSGWPAASRSSRSFPSSCGEQERIVAGDREVAAAERVEPPDVRVEHRVALGAELAERGVHVDGVPQHDAVDHQPERAELVLHPVVVSLVQLALVAVEHPAAEGGT
jgi:hypothetical protein